MGERATVREDHSGHWYPNRMPRGEIMVTMVEFDGEKMYYQIVANVGAIMVSAGRYTHVLDAREAASRIAAFVNGETT